ncbi:MAG TPA: hypothetical protein VFG42_07700 [Baekduia sp.]|uniref:hypothetical protein n=1 Tax=Baekduia sp. TaxID=2600305 RepID=UPI002D78AB46|nr:hypothetical protein [Baekduia sp.]HET6506657.1 hypothetical protein [Baekduia sp.]
MVIPRLLYAAGVRSVPMHVTSLGCIGLCLSLWIRAKTVDQEERDNAERRAIFVGLWPSMFWLLGNAVAEQERSTVRRARRAARRSPRR